MKILAAIPIICLLAAGCGASERKKEAEAGQKAGPRPPARVDAFLVATRSISESIEVPGTIVAADATEIHPEVSGRITALNVREGAVVGQGSLIAKLDDAELQAQRRKLQVQLAQAQTTVDRYSALAKIGGISKQDLDVAELQISNARADLAIVNANIRKTEVRAPFTGKLGLKMTSPGAYVSPQSVLTSIQKTSGMRIDFSLPEQYVGRIKQGSWVNFSTANDNRVYSAQVIATESGIGGGTRTLTMRALVKGDATGLVPGAFARVKIAFDPNPNAMMIPTQAIVPQARGKRVYVIDSGNVKAIDVITGIRDSSFVQITSGLNVGDTVAITGILGLKPGGKAIVRKVINAPHGGKGNPADTARAASAKP
ncbi:efflux RND transporter periplasmic adaptor subunit [Flaviaesturariibacter flavus]|uniref:Efflux RND transporter periplasmic adaptor subunit n=1 Tax=Flaviaesturariibacter flavus TaxID=2502780 RepID=A0A4R1BA71_9BACT|nr:efflux RND transporter periplasmic adaptor subunit [Flaviaesturariibacter flavus]